MSNKIFQDENKELANIFLNDAYYNSFKKGKKAIELFLLGKCKANCQYCYLKQHPELYPNELHDYSLIIANLEKILDWYIDNKFTCKLDIFSGEWLTTPLADQVFDLFENKFSKIDQEYRPRAISMPDNAHFLESEFYTAKVESYIERMAHLNIPVHLSLSVDGYYCDYDRKNHKDDFYKTLNDFCIKHNYGIHPMVSSGNVQHWIENYKWWKNTYPEISNDIMMLEVRDNSWTPESLQALIDFCDFLFDDKFKEYNYDKEKFLKYIFCLFGRGISSKKEDKIYHQTNPILLRNHGVNLNIDRMSCSTYVNLAIRVADLTVGPCHRLFYPEWIFGKYNIDENGNITDFEPKNVSSLIAYKNIKVSCLPYCEKCLFNNFCLGHCFGASYETLGNPFVPNKEVCNLYKSEITFILYKLHQLNLLDKEGLEILQNHMTGIEFQQFYALYQSIIINSDLEKSSDLD